MTNGNNEKVLESLQEIASGNSVEDKNLPYPTVNLRDLFTRNQIIKARKLFPDTTKIQKEVVEPQLEHINRVTGQENDARYFSYALIHMLTENPKIGISYNHDWSW